MDVVPLLLGDRSTNIVSCHLCLIKQPLKDKQGGCREQKSVLALTALFSCSKPQIYVKLPVICLARVNESYFLAMLTGLLWFSIGQSLRVENKLLKLRQGVFYMRCELR